MRKRTIVQCLAALLLLVLALPPGSSGHALAAQSGPKQLRGTVPDVVAQGRAEHVGRHTPVAGITISVGLPLRDPVGLDAFLAQVNDPTSPNYHQFLTQDQANASFNPTAQQEARVIQWLRAGGLTVTATYPNHLLVDARGTVAQVEALVHSEIHDYRATIHGKPVGFFAPSVEPSVDASVSDVVQSVSGLDSVPRFHVSSNGLAHGTPAYYPQDFANAYNVNPLWAAGYSGAGQHIGITLWTVPPSDTTLQKFGSTTGASVATVANGRLKIIPVDGGTTATLSPDAGEAGMDIESSGGIAPGAIIDYYEAPTDSTGNPTDQGLEDALNIAGTDSNFNRQITNSWGGCEATSTSDPFTSTTNNIFSSNSATGHNYLFSSGDNGSWCTTDPAPNYPTSSPYVTSVGGAKFNGSVGSTYPGESAWAYCTTCNAGSPEGSGGGYSSIYGRPSWQTGSGLAANGKRGYPDISADADPNTGAYVCYGSTPSCGQIGGTSLASPLWAGMLAVINNYLSGQSKPALGFLDPVLYNLATHTQTYLPFHDVTSGTNGAYNTSAAWDAVTGWGSIDVYNVARDLAGGTVATSTPTSVPPPTPTNTPTVVPTATMTPTPSAGPTNTPTAAPTATKTPTPAPGPTNTPSVVPTATRTPTPTPGPTNTPTSTPTARQLIVNGGFESGQPPWGESSTNGYQIIDLSRPHSGTHSAWMCGYNNCNDQIYQTVTLPATFTKVTLGYWYYSDTQESAGSPCYDYFYARIKSSLGGIITTPQQSCNNGVTNGWVYKSFDLTLPLTAYRGQSVTVAFQGVTNTTFTSNFFVDDVTVNAS